MSQSSGGKLAVIEGKDPIAELCYKIFDWGCQNNKPALNVSKTEELIIALRSGKGEIPSTRLHWREGSAKCNSSGHTQLWGPVLGPAHWCKYRKSPMPILPQQFEKIQHVASPGAGWRENTLTWWCITARFGHWNTRGTKEVAENRGLCPVHHRHWPAHRQWDLTVVLPLGS